MFAPFNAFQSYWDAPGACGLKAKVGFETGSQLDKRTKITADVRAIAERYPCHCRIIFRFIWIYRPQSIREGAAVIKPVLAACAIRLGYAIKTNVIN
jgi:hypothetical protein